MSIVNHDGLMVFYTIVTLLLFHALSYTNFKHLNTGLSKITSARVRDIAPARQTQNTTRDLHSPRRTSDILLDKPVREIYFAVH